MKQLKKIKLNRLNDVELRDREMNNLRGGDNSCGCGCHYANSGGSSIETNWDANYDHGYTSSGGTVNCKQEISGSISNTLTKY